MQDGDADAEHWGPRGSRLVTRNLQADDDGDVARLASRTPGGAWFQDAFRSACAAHADADRPWIEHSLAVENPAGGFLCLGLHALSSDVAHERRVELSVLLDAKIARSALAPVFLEALERDAIARVAHRGNATEARADRDDVDTSNPAVLRLTVVEDPSVQAVAEQRGFVVAHAEDDMACTRPSPIPLDAAAGDLVAWRPETAGAFFEAYEASFRDRPGFPGWSESRWRAFSTAYDAFRPDLSHVLMRAGAPLAFRIVAVEDGEASIVQMGVVPSARRQGIGRALIGDLARRLPDGIRALTLSVNADNPAARALFEQAGFAVARRRTVLRKDVLP